MTHELVAPGAARLTAVQFESSAFRRAARIAKLTVRSYPGAALHPLTFAENTYAGYTLSENEQRDTPDHLIPLTTELDKIFPDELQVTSILRERFRGRRDVEPMHPDTVNDYRTITVLNGEGEFCMHTGSGEIDESGIILGSHTIKLKTGSVLVMNNLVGRTEQKLWHRVRGGMLLMVYGKYEKRGLTWQS